MAGSGDLIGGPAGAAAYDQHLAGAIDALRSVDGRSFLLLVDDGAGSVQTLGAVSAHGLEPLPELDALLALRQSYLFFTACVAAVLVAEQETYRNLVEQHLDGP